MKKERKKIKFNIKDKLKFKKDNTIKAEKSKFVLTKEACIILFVIISLLIFNSVLFVSKIIPDSLMVRFVYNSQKNKKG